MGAWLSAQRLSGLPLVLSGPVLRRVDSSSVTVWLALKEKARVTLEVYDGDAAPRSTLMSGQRDTIALGANLHLVVVTARAGTKLEPNKIYFYDVSFDFQTHGKKTLSEAAAVGTSQSFAYAPFALPTFALPPTTIQDCRIIHGSCRKPHGEGIDALPLLDDLIRDTAQSPILRPHQLMLAGDQIYADDVAHGLLLMLTDVGDTLLGWTEDLPMPASLRKAGHPATFHAADWGPQTRIPLIYAAGFTTDDMRCHLMSLGEYLAMYLFVWSDVLWPAVLPVKDDVPDYVPPGEGAGSRAPRVWSDEQQEDFEKRFDVEATQIDKFRQVLGLSCDKRSVRRALANVPVATICDDHEVTDDWNMTREFCENIYGDPLGFRVVQNALTAYSLCQAWGNTPEQFEDDPQRPAGVQLLNLLDGTNSSRFTDNSPAIARLIGVHDAGALAAGPAPYRVFHDPGKYVTVNGWDVNDTSIDYHYAIEADAYKVIVTDSRSWRSFPKPGKRTHPDLIEPSMMARQLGNVTPRPAGTRDVGNRLLLVVLTTNFPPIKSIRMAAQLPILGVYEHDLYDSWEMPSRAFDQLIVEMTKLFPQAATIQGRAIVLSGDVHFSFASRLGYRAETRLGQASQPAELVVAQLVGSAFQNETDDTRGEEEHGYGYTPHWVTNRITPPRVPTGAAGWNYSGTARRVVGMGGDMQIEVHPLITDEPTYDFTELQDWAWKQKPDFRYRLDYLVTAVGGVLVPSSPVLPPASGTTPAGRLQGLKNIHTATGFGNEYLVPGRPELVGHNNLGDISFYTSGSDVGVRYKLRCHVGDQIAEPIPSWFYVYDVLLSLYEKNADGTVKYPFFPERILP